MWMRRKWHFQTDPLGKKVSRSETTPNKQEGQLPQTDRPTEFVVDRPCEIFPDIQFDHHAKFGCRF